MHGFTGGRRDGRQQLAGRGAAPDPCAEVGERVVRRGPVPVGQAVGKTDEKAKSPGGTVVERPITAPDFFATIGKALGIES